MEDWKIFKQTNKQILKCGNLVHGEKSQSTFKCFLSARTKIGLSNSACEKVTQQKHFWDVALRV